jgi:hypothetical protein
MKLDFTTFLRRYRQKQSQWETTEFQSYMNNRLKRKYEIFVGSTFAELKIARRQIINSIALAGHIPCGTELWPAESDSPSSAIIGYLDTCDIHVLIVGYRYGSLVAVELEDEPISYTHWEYRRSLEAGRPIVVFMLSNTDVAKKRKEEKKGNRTKELDNEEWEFGPKVDEKFAAFRADLQKEHLMVHFNDTPEGTADLAGQCIAAISRLTALEIMPAASGWIRADSNEGKTLRAIDGNPFLKRVTDQIRQFETLADRVEQNKKAKQAMARHFWFYMQSRIRILDEEDKNGVNLFFESGSSLAYVGQEFETAVLDEAGILEPWHIRTNNIICLLQFDLNSGHDARCFPNGKPDPRDKYGAIFPEKWGVLHREPPQPNIPRNLSDGESRAVEEIQNDFKEKGPTIVLAAASGWDIDSKEDLFLGPHVGSHKNMLIKRALFTTGCPVILFLDADKLGSKRECNCYPVFGPEMPLGKAIKEFPLAICVGWEWPKFGKQKHSVDEFQEYEKRNNPNFIATKLEEIGFKHQYFCEKEEDSEEEEGRSVDCGLNDC